MENACLPVSAHGASQDSKVAASHASLLISLADANRLSAYDLLGFVENPALLDLTPLKPLLL